MSEKGRNILKYNIDLDIFPTDYFREYMWVGMTIRDSTTRCTSSINCLNKMAWLSDDTPYNIKVTDDWFGVNDGDYCVGFNGGSQSNGVNDLDCARPTYFACEFSCNQNAPGMCPSNSAAGKVQIPAGYIYRAATKKYYKPYKEYLDWKGAQLQCNSDGATLIESRTHAEHEALKWIYGRLSYLGGDEVYYHSVITHFNRSCGK